MRLEGEGYTYLLGSYLAEAAPGCWLSLSISGGACPSSLSDALADESSSWGSQGGVEIGPGGPIFDNAEKIWGLLRHQCANYSAERLPSALSLFLCRFCCNCSFFCLLLNGFFRGIVQICWLSTSITERAKKGKSPLYTRYNTAQIKTRGNPHHTYTLHTTSINCGKWNRVSI